MLRPAPSSAPPLLADKPKVLSPSAGDQNISVAADSFPTGRRGSKMADSLIGATIQVALEQVVSFATDQIGMVVGFKKDLERLRETVKMILAVIDDAEEKQVKDRPVNLWLKKLQELACRAEHVLDEVNYEMLRRRVEDQNRQSKVRLFSSHDALLFRLRMAHKLKKINTEFEVINRQNSALGLQSRLGVATAAASYATLLPTNSGSSRETDSVARRKVIGRENDAYKIVEMLLSPCNELLSFFPIIGMGGLGKTTLAQFVYNNEQIVEHFGKRIWVWVSEDFEPKRIFKLILESLTSNHVASFEGRDTLVQQVKEKLEGKKFLLVLDDVWSENRELWDNFLCSLAGITTTTGNWIIVTTRKLQVASNLPAGRALSLEKLSDEDCLHIVRERALLPGEGMQEFEAISEEIKEVCLGLPLAASVIGGLLYSNPKEEWLSLLQKGISNMSEDESTVMQILKLSFHHLPSPCLKKCFTYCSLFKKGSLMGKEKLIQLWMAEGFLQPKFGNNMEIGNRYINSLLQSSLLQEVIDEDGKSKCVRMHDLVHDFARLILKFNNDVRDIIPQDRYLVVDSLGEEIKTLPKKRMKMLQTLFLGSDIADDMLAKFTRLHVLTLSQLKTELPSSVGKLMHLRYLDLSGSGIKTLPESLCKLYNLQTLRIYGCHNLKALPKGMTKLISLRHLHFDSRHRMPPEMGRLTSLQTLESFQISQENQIKELGRLENLRGKLTIYNLERVSCKEEALQAGLYRKPMNILEFYWSGEGAKDEEVLDGLQPHPNLQELRIMHFLGSQFPSWFMNMAVCMDQNLGLSKRLDKLVSLFIRNCKRCMQLPALGQLPSLKYLTLSGLDNISCIDPSFYGINKRSVSGNNIGRGQGPEKVFPAVRHLRVTDMKNLKEWMESEGVNGEAVEMFPNLEDLSIENCQQLRSVPIHHFQSLKCLHISRTSLNNIFPNIKTDQNCSRSPSNLRHVQEHIPTFLKSLKIEHCDNLRELPDYLYEFQFMQSLEIRYCVNLKSLPIPSRQQRLTSLQKLVIWCCDGLTSLPYKLLESCTSLQDLTIHNCNGLVSLPRELLKSCESLCSLSIWGCHRLASVPADLLESCTSLQSLCFSQLSSLLSFPSDLQEMLSLSSLQLYDVPNLITVPNELASCCGRLSTLRIGGFSNDVEFNWSAFSSWLSLHKLQLHSWPHLLSLPDQLQRLAVLRQLKLFHLAQIVALPEWFGKLVSLEELCLVDCEKLCKLPSMAAMRSLTKLSRLDIYYCPFLEDRCTRWTGPDSEWPKISHISYIRIGYNVINLGQRHQNE